MSEVQQAADTIARHIDYLKEDLRIDTWCIIAAIYFSSLWRLK